MTTRILFAGTQFNGEPDDPIERLLFRLSYEPLYPAFESSGNFIIRDDPALAAGEVQFFGNFAHVSHAFDIRSTDPALIATLTAAIRANQATDAYASVKRGMGRRIAA